MTVVKDTLRATVRVGYDGRVHKTFRGPKAEERFTKPDAKQTIRMLRHRKDRIFDSTCMLFDQDKRRCTVYESRPAVCRGYPDSNRCGYYEFLKFERAHQDDKDFIALT